MHKAYDIELGLSKDFDAFNFGFGNLSVKINLADNMWRLGLFEFFSQRLSATLNQRPTQLRIRVDHPLLIFVQYDSHEWIPVGSPLPISVEGLPTYPEADIAMHNFFAQHFIHPPIFPDQIIYRL